MKRGAALLALGSLVAGFVLRGWGIGQGYPEFYGDVDEIGVAASIWSFFRAGTLRPTEFTYPGFYSYLTAASVWLSGAAGLVPRLGSLRDSLVLASFVDPAWVALVGRSVSAVLSTLVIGIAYRLGCEAYDRRTGAIASLFTACASLPIGRAHMALPDSTMAFLAALCFYFSWKIAYRGARLDYVLAGLCAGLVVATKYNGAFTALSLVAAHAMRCRSQGRGWRPTLFSPRLWTAVALAVAALAAGSPYLILAWEQYAAVARYQVSSLDFAMGRTAPWWWVAEGLVRSEYAVGALMLAGMVWTMRKREPLDWLFLAAWVPSFLYIGSWTRESLHYFLHFYPLLAINAARVLEAAAGKGQRYFRRLPLAYLLAGAGALPSAYLAWAGDAGLAKTDTRAVAAAWIEANVPAGARLGMTWLPYCPRVALASVRQGVMEYYRGNPHMQARLHEAWEDRPAYELVNLEAWLKQPVVPALYRGLVDLEDPETRRVFSRVWLEVDQLRERGVEYLVLPEAVYGRYMAGPEPPAGTAAHYHYLRNSLYFARLTDPDNPQVRRVASLTPGPGIRGGAIHVFRLQP